MKPQLVLRFLMEGAGGFINADVFATEDEARDIIQRWASGAMGAATYRHPSGAWAVHMGTVRGIFTFAIPAGQMPAQNQPRPFQPQYSGN